MSIVLFFVLFGFCPTYAQWTIDFKKAQETAASDNKLILLNFSGSDWCLPCMRLKRDFFSREEFKVFASENLVLVNADFPRKRENMLNKEQQALNESLAEKYNKQGAFPAIFLLDADGHIICHWIGYPKVSIMEFIDKINSFVAHNQRTDNLHEFKKDLILMGSAFIILVVEENEQIANKSIEMAVDEIKRIENMISSWDKKSETAKINEYAGIKPVKVSIELFELIDRSKNISELTQGAFDISFGSVDEKLWHFDGSMEKMPDSSVLKESVKLINYRNILLNIFDTTVFLKHKGMRIGFGAIGKGYAAEKAMKLLKDNGIESGIINAGGDLAVWGIQADGSAWTIGIANPDIKNLPFSWLQVSNMAVVTSGNYEKFVEIAGKRYSHIIDPRTGIPVSGLKSVTVICENAELADALATSVFILGQDIGIDLIEQLKGVEVIIIDDQNRIFTSSNINMNQNE
ncbi:FAD:protein FMN transferase [Bacteroidota bacterium]